MLSSLLTILLEMQNIHLELELELEPDREPDMFDNDEEYVGVDDEGKHATETCPYIANKHSSNYKPKVT